MYHTGVFHFYNNVHTEVSELILRTNLLDLGSMISSEMFRCGSLCTEQRRDTSPCRSWNTAPSLMARLSMVSQIRAQPWLPESSRSF